MEKIHLVSEERGQKVFLKGLSEKVSVTFNKYKAMEFSTIEEAQAVANVANKLGSRTYTVAIMDYFEELEVVKVNITDDHIKVIIGIDTLLFTKNNIMAYHKLMKVLGEVEGITFKLWVDNQKLFDIEDKEEFIKTIKEFLGK